MPRAPRRRQGRAVGRLRRGLPFTTLLVSPTTRTRDLAGMRATRGFGGRPLVFGGEDPPRPASRAVTDGAGVQARPPSGRRGQRAEREHHPPCTRRPWSHGAAPAVLVKRSWSQREAGVGSTRDRSTSAIWSRRKRERERPWGRLRALRTGHVSTGTGRCETVLRNGSRRRRVSSSSPGPSGRGRCSAPPGRRGANRG